jgi:hypothetical protein
MFINRRIKLRELKDVSVVSILLKDTISNFENRPPEVSNVCVRVCGCVFCFTSNGVSKLLGQISSGVLYLTTNKNVHINACP